MANNYDQFSEVLLLGKDVLDEKKAWVSNALALAFDPESYDTEDEAVAVFKKRLGQLLDDEKLAESVNYPESWPDFQHELLEDDDGTFSLHLYGEENFDLDHVITFVQAYLKKFDPKGFFRLTWAGTCSKMRVSEFTGGYAVIGAEKYVASSAHSDAEELVVAMMKESGGHLTGEMKTEAVMAAVPPTWEKKYATDDETFVDAVNRISTNAARTGRFSSSAPNLSAAEVFAKKYETEGHGLKETLERVAEAMNEEDPEQNTQRALNSLVGCYSKEGETYGDTMQRMLKDTAFGRRVDVITQKAYCECDGHPLVGVMVNTDYDQAVIERCDTCSLFASDDHAAFFVARLLNKEVEFAIFREGMSPRPYIKDMSPDDVLAAIKMRIP